MSKFIQRIELDSMSPGTERFVKAHRYGKAGARPKAYLQASLHADEIPGMLAAHHLIRLLDDADARGEIKGEIIVVPVANPVGAGQVINTTFAGRYDLRSGINFNRRWPDLSQGLAAKVKGKLGKDPDANVAIVRQAMGEIVDQIYAVGENAKLRRELMRLAYDSDIVLDLHCDDIALMHIYTTHVFWPQARDLAAEVGARAVLLCDDSGAASFDESLFLPWYRLQKEVGPDYPVPAPVLTSTVEFRGRADVYDEIASQDARALFRFLQRRGLIAGDPGPLPELKGKVTHLDACEILRTPRAGIIAYRKREGDVVKAGEVIAEIVDPLADDPKKARIELRCQADGPILSIRAMKAVGAGDLVAMIVGDKLLPNPTGLMLSD
ncbi:succinylglutamate desuccinylase/aspartoacylase family protein [Dongia deserti]|uniref:succinylglutamate desuccinylase/aspartoacylase family protein n=1 Tax=Dongia deserti TaxID=2268030 RepID=UPI000E652179|nr:succinylglutamate desuccinylase/aspartoacylase family protein [Dongia deserti]